MKLKSFIGDHNVPLQTEHIREVIGIIRKNFPYVNKIKTVVDYGDASSQYPNAKCNCLRGVKFYCYFDNIVLGRNWYGDRICTSGIKFTLREQVDKNGVHMFDMGIYGIGRYFPSGGRDLSIIEVRPFDGYKGCQYDTDFAQFDWDGIKRFFEYFLSIEEPTKAKLRGIVRAFEKSGNSVSEIANMSY